MMCTWTPFCLSVSDVKRLQAGSLYCLLQSLPLCEEPNQRIHMDLFGPLLCRSATGNKYIMVITDSFSKYTELAAIPDKTAVTVAKAFFDSWICRHR